MGSYGGKNLRSSEYMPKINFKKRLFNLHGTGLLLKPFCSGSTRHDPFVIYPYNPVQIRNIWIITLDLE
jgi:hypothetical protein